MEMKICSSDFIRAAEIAEYGNASLEWVGPADVAGRVSPVSGCLPVSARGNQEQLNHERIE